MGDLGMRMTGGMMAVFTEGRRRQIWTRSAVLANETRGKTEGWMTAADRQTAQPHRDDDLFLLSVVCCVDGNDDLVDEVEAAEEGSLPKSPNGMTQLLADGRSVPPTKVVCR